MIRTVIAVVVSVVGCALALLVCWGAAADAQGAVGFVTAWPLALVLAGIGLALVVRAPRRPRFWMTATLFAVTACAPLLLRPVSSAFEAVTGRSPYAWEHRNRATTATAPRHP